MSPSLKNKIIIKSNKPKSSKRPVITKEQEDQPRNKPKTDRHERTSKDRSTHNRYLPELPKKEKKSLFQVDINMDSKIVRITIHEGDNIDKIVKKFDSIFNLNPKQVDVLSQRLKNQYAEMIEARADSEDY